MRRHDSQRVDVTSGRIRGALYPGDRGGTGVLVLAGSSGRVDEPRARALSRRGATALALGWFGGDGQARSISEAPLELFSEALDVLESRGAGRLAIVGISKGAEAALLVACREPRVDAVVAIAPSSVAWAELGRTEASDPTLPPRSSWTANGLPVPFVPYDEAWRPADAPGPPEFRDLYVASMARFPAAVDAAAIPVDRCAAHLVLIAGGDDRVWPSVPFAERLAARRRAAGLSVELFTSPAAGHRIPFPGEPRPEAGAADLRRGGSPEADAALGRAAWPAVQRALHLV
jgi:hypothetical protein